MSGRPSDGKFLESQSSHACGVIGGVKFPALTSLTHESPIPTVRVHRCPLRIYGVNEVMGCRQSWYSGGDSAMYKCSWVGDWLTGVRLSQIVEDAGPLWLVDAGRREPDVAAAGCRPGCVSRILPRRSIQNNISEQSPLVGQQSF